MAFGLKRCRLLDGIKGAARQLRNLISFRGVFRNVVCALLAVKRLAILLGTIVGVISATLAAPTAVNAAEELLARLPAILSELRQGGFVIYFRHTATGPQAQPANIESLDRCEAQRNLSAVGRQQAVDIGKAMRALGIPVGSVLASPFCRTRDMAKLAFGRFEVEKDLYYVMSTDAVETKRLAQSLQQMLSTAPAPGTNTVLVSHSANLQEAAGIFPKPEGVAIIFRPHPDGRIEAIGRVLPQDWSKVTILRPSDAR